MPSFLIESKVWWVIGLLFLWTGLFKEFRSAGLSQGFSSTFMSFQPQEAGILKRACVCLFLGCVCVHMYI